LQPGGTLHTIDINEELSDVVNRYLDEAGLQERVTYHIGNALEIIPEIEGPFDLVFIDADKTGYSNYFDMVLEKMNPGAYILADNVLWSGKVLGTEKIDEDTQAIIDFNRKVQEDPRVENVLFPVRDGIMVLRKT
jgi:predicted O-methyltransferase YrrM